MIKGAKLLAPALLLIVSLLMPLSALAIDIPVFPACSNPSGTKIVDVGTGIHGIVGDQNTYKGSDKVYVLPEGNFMQCFCSENGNGIQTNWWRFASITEEQRNILRNLGWIYVPSGDPWGLGDSEYFAQNAGFSCGAGAGGGSSSGSSIAGQVLGLAFTGDISYVYAFVGTGMLLATLGFILSRNK